MLLLPLVLSLASPRPPSPTPDEEPILLGRGVVAVLDEATPERRWRWDCAETCAVVLCFDSDEFPPRLEVRDLGDGRTWDNLGGRCANRARLFFPGDGAHEYEIRVGSADSGRGRFTLQLDPATDESAESDAARIERTARLFEQRRTSLGDTETRTQEVRLDLARLLMNQILYGRGDEEDSRRAVELARTGLARCGEAPDDVQRAADFASVLGTVLESQGRTADAYDVLERTSRRLASAGLERSRAGLSLAIVRAGLLGHLGLPGDDAASPGSTPLEELLLDAERILGPSDRFAIEAQQALVRLWVNGSEHLDEGRRLLERAIARVATLEWDSDWAATACALELNLAILLRSLAQYAAAQDHAERALEICDRSLAPGCAYAAAAHVQLGILHYDQGRYREAIAELELGRDQSEASEGETSPRAMSSRNTLAAVHSALGETELAREELEQLIELADEQGGPERARVAAYELSLAVLSFRAGDGDEALDLHEDAYRRNLDWSGSGSKASLLALSGWASALEHRDPDRTLEMRREVLDGHLRQLRAQLAVLTEGERLRRIAADTVDFARYLSTAARAPSESAAEQYQRVLEWKGLAGRGLCVQRAWLRSRGDAQLESVSGELADLDLRSALRGEESEKDTVARRDALERALAEATRAAIPRAPPPEALVASLREDEVLVDFVAYLHQEPLRPGSLVAQAQERLTAFVSTRQGGVVRVDLGARDEIERQIGAYRRLLQRWVPGEGEPPSAATLERVGRPLKERLLDPLQPWLAGRRQLGVVPDGEIATVPWPALWLGADRFLVEELEVRSWLFAEDRLRDPGAFADPGALLVVGDVDYGDPDGPFAALPHSREEITAVSSALRRRSPGAEVLELSGSEAAVSALRESAPGARWLHLATHGTFERQRLSTESESALALGQLPPGVRLPAPREGTALPSAYCGLALSGANDPRSPDGLWTALDVSWLPLESCELVVLSACESGLGTPQLGEGLLGLRRAFRLAGAHAVVSTLWKIPDVAGSAFMARFYGALWDDGLEASAALRRAQLETLAAQRTGGVSAAPGTWGAYLCEGGAVR